MLSIFSGIGGLELGLSMGGDFHPVAFVEQNLYARFGMMPNQIIECCHLGGIYE